MFKAFGKLFGLIGDFIDGTSYLVSAYSKACKEVDTAVEGYTKEAAVERAKALKELKASA